MTVDIADIRRENFRLARIKAAAYFRTEEGRKQRKEQAIKIQSSRPVIQKICEFCNQTFSSKCLKEQKYCSKKCKSAYRRKHGLDNITGHCAICNNQFSYNKFSGNIFCSSQCRLINKSSSGQKGHLISGYRVIYKPNHPNCHSRGKIMEHIFVMSEHLARPLRKGENVHHKNGIRHDNRLENLELWHKGQPAGQRVEDKIEWAKKFLEEYGFEVKNKT